MGANELQGNEPPLPVKDIRDGPSDEYGAPPPADGARRPITYWYLGPGIQSGGRSRR